MKKWEVLLYRTVISPITQTCMFIMWLNPVIQLKLVRYLLMLFCSILNNVKLP